jgi:hypothetical protein
MLLWNFLALIPAGMLVGGAYLTLRIHRRLFGSDTLGGECPSPLPIEEGGSNRDEALINASTPVSSAGN